MAKYPITHTQYLKWLNKQFSNGDCKHCFRCFYDDRILYKNSEDMETHLAYEHDMSK